jgi:hypothetical protein
MGSNAAPAWFANGQKSGLQARTTQDYDIIVTHIDLMVPKHKRLMFFFLDMKSPGIEIRPIKQIASRGQGRPL